MSTTRVTGAAPVRRPASAVPRREQHQRHAPHEAPGAVVAVRRIFAAENANYFLLLGVSLFLVAFGLVMVLSSSSIDSYKQNGGNSFADFLRQGMYALIGLPLMLRVGGSFKFSRPR